MDNPKTKIKKMTAQEIFKKHNQLLYERKGFSVSGITEESFEQAYSEIIDSKLSEIKASVEKRIVERNNEIKEVKENDYSVPFTNGSTMCLRNETEYLNHLLKIIGS